jgi:type IV secretory pathway VirB2 component (pilin)
LTYAAIVRCHRNSLSFKRRGGGLAGVSENMLSACEAVAVLQFNSEAIMKKFFNTFLQYMPVLVVVALCLDASLAQAAGPVGGGGAGGGMPWESPLKAIQAALTGGAAKALAVIAMAVAGGMLAFGGELSEFAKRICMVVIAAATMIFAANVMNAAGLG